VHDSLLFEDLKKYAFQLKWSKQVPEECKFFSSDSGFVVQIEDQESLQIAFNTIDELG